MAKVKQNPPQTVGKRAANALEKLAVKGNLRAIKALTDGTMERLDPGRGDKAAMPSHVAAAMIAAGLHASLIGPEATDKWVAGIKS